MLSSGTTSYDTDLAQFIKTTKLSPKDLKVGDILVCDFNTWHIRKIHAYRNQGSHAQLRGRMGRVLTDIDDNSTWIADDETVTIIDRSCLR